MKTKSMSISFRAESGEQEKIRQYAYDRGISLSRALRELIGEKLAYYESPPPVPEDYNFENHPKE